MMNGESVGAETILSVNSVSKRFILKKKKVEREIPALAEVSFDVREGEFLSIVGPSGCGKSTILNLVVGLLKPTSGDILLRGEKVEGINSPFCGCRQRRSASNSESLAPSRETIGW